jgi:hypothetical protein
MFLNRLFDIVSFTQSAGTRYVYIVLMSLISAVIFLLIFKKTSNQQKITYHKDQILGHVLQIPLYKDRFGLIFLSIFNIVKHNVLYIQQTLIPLLFMVIPLIILMVQINNRCGYEPLHPGQQFVIQAELNANTAPEILESLYCETSPAIQLETPALRIETERTVFWRARIVEQNSDSLPVIRIGNSAGEQPIERSVVTRHGGDKRFSPEKKQWTFWNSVFTNAEGFLPADTPLSSITIRYQRTGYPLFFWRADAIILYFVFTLIFGFAMKGVFRVKI